MQGMPRKLDEPVQEKGSNFSAGTVQLICIARLLLAKQRIVFLDECTASVDLKTDAQVQSAIRSACGDCAILCIAQAGHDNQLRSLSCSGFRAGD